MSSAPRLIIGVGELAKRLGSRKPLARFVVLDHLAITTAAVPEGAEIVVELEAESISNGIVIHGTVTVPWVGACRRCLADVRGSSVADVREIFERNAVEGETYPFDGETIDLEPMVRDAALLTLPLAPLCRDDCLGPAPDAFPATVEDDGDDGDDEDDEDEGAEPVDPRWSALDQLKFD